MEVDGKVVVKDVNTIATFQSTVKNSFIRLANNDDPNSGTNVGYVFDSLKFLDRYFFIDLPQGDFGEFVITPTGNVGIGSLRPEGKLGVYSDQFYTIYAVNTHANGHAVTGVLGQGSTGSGVFGESLTPTGTAVEGFAQAGGCDFDATGPGANYCSTSSRRWKTYIQNFTDPIDKLSRIRGVSFVWDKAHGGHYDIGFIAEEVGEIMPEVVVYEENGIDASGMDYSKMTPLLVEAANAMRKEYQNKFDEQQLQINQLIEQVAEISVLMKEITELKTLLSSPDWRLRIG